MSARRRRRRAWPKQAPRGPRPGPPGNRCAIPLHETQSASPPAQPHPPRTGWERQTERRLRAIEQQLANQNRLLLVAILTVAGDIVLGLTR